mmetsp:Transcript_7928/g.11848  ORF Transcript_7928/g.11848 Transcript_7928/m.11848 type:complete len:406 (+) Transcript_7928:1415-2632(+)
MGSDSYDGPDTEISLDIGSIGISIYGSLLIITVYASCIAINRYSKSLFVFGVLYCISEMPIYWSLAIEQTYKNQDAYAVHILGQVLFFCCLSFACFLLHDACSISHVSSPLGVILSNKKFPLISFIFRRRSLVITNFLFSILALTTAIVCIKAPSLQQFFDDSVFYLVFTIFDAAKNLLLALCLLYYGLKLREKITDLMNDVQNSRFLDPNTRESFILTQLRASNRRLVIAMVICSCCFLLRTTMLLVKVFVVQNQLNDPFASWMPTYGIIWWTLEDFIPRCLPILCFFRLFGMPRKLNNNDVDVQTRAFHPESEIENMYSTPLRETKKSHRFSDEEERHSSIIQSDSFSEQPSECNFERTKSNADLPPLPVITVGPLKPRRQSNDSIFITSVSNILFRQHHNGE